QVEEGTQVRAGDVLCVVESTKATVDIEAPVSGYIRQLAVRRGVRAKVGQAICVIAATVSEKIEVAAETRSSGEGMVRATKKARELAQRHGFDISSIKAEGIITERDVEARIDSKWVASPRKADSRLSGDRVLVYGASGHAK